VHLNGEPERSCSLPVSAAEGKDITTVEGLMKTPTGQALQAGWIKAQAPQCGYCQSGQLMAAAKVISVVKKDLSRTEILEAMSGNICRCGTYNQIASAVSHAQKTLQGGKA
jgi:isoquinoline 1-oxidoreductase alpha subunit